MPHRVEMWKTLRWTGLAAVMLAGVWLLAVRPIERAMGQAGATLEHGLDKVLGAVTNTSTRIVEGRAEIIESAEVTELALLEMRMSAVRSFCNEAYVLKYLPAGTKKLIVRGHYQVKAGYRLDPGVSLRLDDGRPVARFPAPEVLSVELVDFEILSEEDGWLNRVTPSDRAQVLRELREQMRAEARRSGMLDTAEATLRTRLRDLLGTEQVEIERAGAE